MRRADAERQATDESRAARSTGAQEARSPMSMLVWVMMGIAIWHFTVWVPDRFWGGIVGAFLAATLGAVIFGLIVDGFSIPGRNETDIGQALIAIPGSLLGLGRRTGTEEAEGARRSCRRRGPASGAGPASESA